MKAEECYSLSHYDDHDQAGSRRAGEGQRNWDCFLYLQLAQVLHQVIVYLLRKCSSLDSSKESIPARIPLQHLKDFTRRTTFYFKKEEVNVVELNP